MPTLKIEEVTPASVINLGKLKIKFFDITHVIPDAIGVIIETPYGNVIYPRLQGGAGRKQPTCKH